MTFKPPDLDASAHGCKPLAKPEHSLFMSKEMKMRHIRVAKTLFSS